MQIDFNVIGKWTINWNLGGNHLDPDRESTFDLITQDTSQRCAHPRGDALLPTAEGEPAGRRASLASRRPYCSRDMFGEKATAMVERLQRATWLPPYDDTMREVLTEIDELHAKANDWLQ